MIGLDFRQDPGNRTGWMVSLLAIAAIWFMAAAGSSMIHVAMSEPSAELAIIAAGIGPIPIPPSPGPGG